MLRERYWPIFALIVSVVACLGYAALRSELPAWWRGHGGGIPYVLFWILLWFAAFPKRKYISFICVGCVLATCGLELLQAINFPEPLELFRRTWLGAAWLGHGYDSRDIPPYIIGGILGWLVCYVMPIGKSQKTDLASVRE